MADNTNYSRVIDIAKTASTSKRLSELEKEIKKLQKSKKPEDAGRLAEAIRERNELRSSNVDSYNQSVQYSPEEISGAQKAMQGLAAGPGGTAEQALAATDKQDVLQIKGDTAELVKNAVISLKSKYPNDRNMFFNKTASDGRSYMQVTNKYKNEPEYSIINWYFQEMSRPEYKRWQRVTAGIAQIALGMPVMGVTTLTNARINGTPVSPANAIQNINSNFFGTEQYKKDFDKLTDGKSDNSALFNKQLQTYDLGKGNAGIATKKKVSGVEPPEKGAQLYKVMNTGIAAGNQYYRAMYSIMTNNDTAATVNLNNVASALQQVDLSADNTGTVFRYYMFITMLNANDKYKLLPNEMVKEMENYVRTNQTAVAKYNIQSGSATGLTNKVSEAGDFVYGGMYDALKR